MQAPVSEMSLTIPKAGGMRSPWYIASDTTLRGRTRVKFRFSAGAAEIKTTPQKPAK
jgi:hypothetical protein